MDREGHLERFYKLLQRCSNRVGGPRRLKHCHGRQDWPSRGVYFFLAPAETRQSSNQLRCVRVGTHAVSSGSSTTLWSRLKQHYGTGPGSRNHPHGGNHRGSVFRKRVGEAIIERHGLHEEYPSWGRPSSSLERDRTDIRDEEYLLERRVSAYIRELPFLWVDLDDEPSAESDRAFVERNAIAILSNCRKPTIDPRNECWLGHSSPVEEIRESGLWNINHVAESCDPSSLERLERAVEETTPP